MELTMLQSIIAKVLRLNEEEISEDAVFVEDLGADSLDLYEILLEVEETFDIEISGEIRERIVTVADAVRAIQIRTGCQYPENK